MWYQQTAMVTMEVEMTAFVIVINIMTGLITVIRISIIITMCGLNDGRPKRTTGVEHAQQTNVEAEHADRK